MVRPILYVFRIFDNILLLNVMVKISSRIPKFPNFINTDFPTCTESIYLVQANLPIFLQPIDRQKVYSPLLSIDRLWEGGDGDINWCP